MGTPHIASRRELRAFGLVMAGMIAALFGLLLPWLFDRVWPTWPWITAAVFFCAALAAPPILSPAYRAWMAFAHVLGRINTRILMFLVFVAMFIPIGALRRVFGEDPMRRRYNPVATSYRVPHDAHARNDMEKPY